MALDPRHRMTTRLRLWMVPLLGFLLAAPADAGTFDVLRYDEATIADIQAAFKAKTLTCRGLVQIYLDRIDAYDQKAPALNAIVVTNPDALKVADALDAKFAQSGPAGPPSREHQASSVPAARRCGQFGALVRALSTRDNLCRA